MSHHIDVYTLSTADEDFCDLRPWSRSYRVHQFEPLRLFGSPFGRLNPLQRWRSVVRLDARSRGIAHEVDAKGYDVAFTEPCMWSQAPLVLRHLRTPAVYYLQELPRALYESSPRARHQENNWRRVIDRFDPLIRLYQSGARRLDREATKAATRVLVNSGFMRETVARIYGIGAEVSHHGIDTDTFRPSPEIERGDYLLSVGALQPRKGFDFLVESVALLPLEERPPLRLVGNAEIEGEREFLTGLALRLGVDLRIDVGIDDAALARCYNEAALFVYAPHNEPFGLAPLEAMACGTPVVGVAEAGVLETVAHGITGRLVERDAHHFAQVIRQLLASPAERRRLGANGVGCVRDRWTWSAAVSRIEGHLRAAGGANGSVA